MATIREETTVHLNAADAWRVVRDVDHPQRLFPGMLTDARRDGDARVVTFVDGTVLRELIVAVDDEHRRIAYASVGGRASHHNASIEVLDDGDGRSRLVWITDLLPDEIAERIAGLMRLGIADAKRALEQG